MARETLSESEKQIERCESTVSDEFYSGAAPTTFPAAAIATKFWAPYVGISFFWRIYFFLTCVVGPLFNCIFVLYFSVNSLEHRNETVSAYIGFDITAVGLFQIQGLTSMMYLLLPGAIAIAIFLVRPDTRRHIGIKLGIFWGTLIALYFLCAVALAGGMIPFVTAITSFVAIYLPATMVLWFLLGKQSWRFSIGRLLIFTTFVAVVFAVFIQLLNNHISIGHALFPLILLEVWGGIFWLNAISFGFVAIHILQRRLDGNFTSA